MQSYNYINQSGCYTVDDFEDGAQFQRIKVTQTHTHERERGEKIHGTKENLRGL